MALTVSQSPCSAHTDLPRLVHSPNCFKVSTLVTSCVTLCYYLMSYTDLGSRGYFGIKRHSCYLYVGDPNTGKDVFYIETGKMCFILRQELCVLYWDRALIAAVLVAEWLSSTEMNCWNGPSSCRSLNVFLSGVCWQNLLAARTDISWLCLII